MDYKEGAVKLPPKLGLKQTFALCNDADLIIPNLINRSYYFHDIRMHYVLLSCDHLGGSCVVIYRLVVYRH